MSPTHTQKPRKPISLRDWAKEHGRVVTRGELLGILAMDERRRKADAHNGRWRRRLARWARGILAKLW